MGYLRSTRHPWPTLLFLLPLLAAYEGGVLYLAQTGSAVPRNGADSSLRWLLGHFGFGQLYAVPLLLLAWLIFCTFWRWGDRPKDGIGLWLGMAIESVGFALVIWAVSRHFGLILDQLGVVLDSTEGTPEGEALRRVVGFLGAGIYEEVLFRLVLFGFVSGFLRLLLIPGFLAIPIALVLSSLAFAAAHHVGPYGEEMDLFNFAFRATAGAIFGLLYQFRGLGIAVGAHAGYDIIVGVPWG